MASPENELEKTAAELAALLEKLRAAGDNKARIEDQQVAFQLGCNLLQRLVALIEKTSELRGLAKAAEGYEVGIPAGKLQQFIKQELEWLEKRLRLSERDLRDVKENIKALGDEDELGNLKIDSDQVVTGLKQFCDILCNIDVLLKNGIKVSPELVKECLAGVIDACQIAGNVLLVVGGAATGNPTITLGTWLLTVASVGSGIKGLLKRQEKLGSLFRSEKARIEKEVVNRKSAEAIQKKLKEHAPKKKF
jgi:hypothetical protein